VADISKNRITSLRCSSAVSYIELLFCVGDIVMRQA